MLNIDVHLYDIKVSKVGKQINEDVLLTCNYCQTYMLRYDIIRLKTILLLLLLLLLLFIEQKPKAYHTVNEQENVELQGTYRSTSKH